MKLHTKNKQNKTNRVGKCDNKVYLPVPKGDLTMKNNKRYKRCIDEIERIAAHIIEEVGNAYIGRHTELLLLEGKIGKYLPDSFEIAEYLKINIVYKKIEGEMPSYFNRELSTIFISDRYINDGYKSKGFVAHELGHFLLDDNTLSAMNNDILNEYLPCETMKEYKANVFAVILMPQIMGKESWADCSPRILNRRVYNKLLG